ncbi:hypothetical protein RhiirA1_467642 [Rhizophagus irregularis]|uniref:Uncharacterized protein n=1 Tax=Rhizophagus irregularis TaxID=588596 RepID=A0A2N0RBQ0_9GLOM|nr:hypothetical protein RhiirA1_467642 [Rhizophagus irregularis]
MNSYPGQDTLISYLKKKSNKSYHRFLILHKNVVVASVTSDLKWHDLENAWASNYIREVEKIFTDQQEVIETLKQKISLFAARTLETIGKEISLLTAWPLKTIDFALGCLDFGDDRYRFLLLGLWRRLISLLTAWPLKTIDFALGCLDFGDDRFRSWLLGLWRRSISLLAAWKRLILFLVIGL